MVKPYVNDGAITYDEFDNIFSILSKREQYKVADILFENGINLIDEQIDEDTLVLDVEDLDTNIESDYYDDEFEVLYDKSIFEDSGKSEDDSGSLIIHHTVKQSNEILCSLIQQGNRQAMQDLCVKNKRLVDKYVAAYEKRYGNRLHFEDLEQVGFLGLIKAAKRFSIQQGTSFSTYAVFWIKQSIAREIMNNGYAIRIPVHMMERINKVAAEDSRLIGQGLSLNERMNSISEEFGLSEESVRECYRLKNNYLSYTSLDNLVGDEEETTLGELIPDESAESIESIIILKDLRRILLSIIQTLPVREQRVISLRFGLDGDAPKTLEEIGKQYGVTRERIRQIEAKALRKLGHPTNAKHIRDFWEE